MSRLRVTDEHGRPLPEPGLPGRRALAGEQAAPLFVRYRTTTTAATPLLARQGHAGPRRARTRAAGHQRLRGHHRDQAGRGGAALPGRARPCWPPRSTPQDAARPGTARGAGVRGLVPDPPAGPHGLGARRWPTATRPSSRCPRRSCVTIRLRLTPRPRSRDRGGGPEVHTSIRHLETAAETAGSCICCARSGWFPRCRSRCGRATRCSAPSRSSARNPAAASAPATSRSPRTSGCAPVRRSTTLASTAPARRSPRRCRPRCCRPCCRRSPASRPRRCSAPPARATRSAATSTTCSRPASGSGSRSWATSAARAPRPRRSPRSRATRSARRSCDTAHPRASCCGSTTRCCASAWIRAGSRRSRASASTSTPTASRPPSRRAAIRARASCAPPASWSRSAFPGTLLGAVPRVRLQDRTTRLAPGDALILYTDGLTEAGSSEARLVARAARRGGRRRAPRGAQGIVDHLTRAALGDAAAPLRDDIALLALRAL